MQNPKPDNKTVNGYYSRLSLATIVAVYFLILVGGIVRSTGSGMGCPDWPKCFGQYIPPTSADQLPDNYKDIYAEIRHAKNLRFANLLDILGLNETANYLRTEERLLEEADFNATKTWIEYLNRLVGVVIGFLVLALFIYSLRYIKSNTSIFFNAFVCLILLLFQAWIGSIVVSTNLTPWMISVHMLLAILIVGILILIYHRSKNEVIPVQTEIVLRKLKVVIIGGICLMLLQIVLGTRVRESVDVVASLYANTQRDLWIDELGLSFYIHRSLSLIILALHVYLYLLLRRFSENKVVYQFNRFILLLIILEILTGASMAYFAIPAFLQPIHLLVGTLIIGVQFYLYLIINKKKEGQELSYV